MRETKGSECLHTCTFITWHEEAQSQQGTRAAYSLQVCGGPQMQQNQHDAWQKQPAKR